MRGFCLPVSDSGVMGGMRSSARNQARKSGVYAAELFPMVSLDCPYSNPVLARVWGQARAKRIAHPTLEYREKCRAMLVLLGTLKTLGLVEGAS